VAFTVVYLLTGSASAGGGVALIEPACNTVAYPLHEKGSCKFSSDENM
jgi:uncharacterized membrane protein